MSTNALRTSGPGSAALSAADRGLRYLELATVTIAGIVIFIVMWIGVAEIFSRKLFNYPLYGQLDLIELTMSSYALLPISYCWRAAGHIRVDLIIDHFRGRARWIVELLTTVLALVLITAIWPGVLHFFENAWEIGDSTINTQWPTWPSKFVPVVGFSVLWLRLVLETIAYGRLIAHPTAVPIGIPEHHDVMQAALQEAEEVPASAGPAAGGV
jgi:TRAP-type mannitol/chloroaromatic compound transport system permease small subunit